MLTQSIIIQKLGKTLPVLVVLATSMSVFAQATPKQIIKKGQNTSLNKQLASNRVGSAQTIIDEIAIIGTRTEESIKHQSPGVFVISQEELKRVASVHIQQNLSRVPGVSLQRGSGQESLPGIRSAVLTGAGACGNVLVLEEAIPVRGAGVCNVNELFDTHYEQAERVEVLRGPSSAFFGSNALTGSINVVFAPQGRDSLSLELGSNNYARAKAAFSYSSGRVYASVTNDGGFRDDSGFEQQKLSWRHKTQLNNWTLKAGATMSHLDQETAGFIVGRDSYRNATLARQNLNPEAFRKSNALRVWLKASNQLSDRTKIDSTFYIRDTDMDFRLHFLPGKPLETNQQQGYGWQSSVLYTPNSNTALSFGFDGDITDSRLQQFQDTATIGSPFLEATIPVGTHYDYQVDAQQLALFSHLQLNLNDQWTLVAGARWEQMKYEYDNLALDGRTRNDGTICGFGGCRYSRPTDRNDSFTHLSPKLELRYAVSPNWRLSFGIADSFRAPQTTELYRLQRAQQSANLNEVQALNLEAAMQYQGSFVDLALSVYQLKVDNIIIRDSNFFNIDGQSTLSQGLEFSVEHTLNSALKIKTVGSYAKHKYDSDLLLDGVNINGNLVDTAPKFVAAAFLNWQINRSVNTELSANYVSSYFLEPTNNVEYQGHSVFNMNAQYQHSDQWVFSARVLNIRNTRYAERADFTQFTDERYFPGAPRSVFLQAQYQF